jgi:hypothetical protein
MQPRGAESFASSILIGQRVRHPAITRTPRQSNLSAPRRDKPRSHKSLPPVSARTQRASISKNKSRAPLRPRNRQGSGVVERLIPRVPLALVFLRNYRAENDGVEYRAFRRSPAWAMSRNATQSFVAGAYRNATICPSPITGGLFRSAILSFSATDQINVSFRWAGKTTGAGAPKAHSHPTSPTRLSVPPTRLQYAIAIPAPKMTVLNTGRL